MRQYCCDFYGCLLWDLSHSSLADVCVAWHKAIWHALGLPSRTHSVLLAPICNALPLIDELICRYVRFIGSCLESVYSIVSLVTKHGIYFTRTKSPVWLNTQFCCNKYNKMLAQFHDVCKTYVWHHVCSSYSQHVRDVVSVMSELLSVKSRAMGISFLTLCVSLPLVSH